MGQTGLKILYKIVGIATGSLFIAAGEMVFKATKKDIEEDNINYSQSAINGLISGGLWGAGLVTIGKTIFKVIK